MLLRFDLEAAALTTTGSETRLVAAGRFNAAAGFCKPFSEQFWPLKVWPLRQVCCSSIWPNPWHGAKKHGLPI